MGDSFPSSSFLGCINPSNMNWQSFSLNQINPSNSKLFQSAFPTNDGDCEECRIKFTFLKRKKLCNDCGLSYCSRCLNRQNLGQRQCRKCKVFSNWPASKAEIPNLHVRDLKYFLNTRKIPTDTFKEKQELVDLVIVQLRTRHFGVPSTSNRSVPTSTTTFETPSSSAPVPETFNQDGIRVGPTSASAIPMERDSSIRVFSSERTTNSESPEQKIEGARAVENDSGDTESMGSSWSLLQEAMVESAEEVMQATSLMTNEEEDTESHSSAPGNQTSLTLPMGSEDEPILQAVSSEPDNSQESEVPESSSVTEPSVPIIPNVPTAVEVPVIVPSIPVSEPPPIRRSTVTRVDDVVKLSSLPDEASLTALSVRQCKGILAMHRVDFSGVREKHELVAKVKMLWENYRQQSIKPTEDMDEAELCKICMDAAADCVLLECGHLLSCTPCGKRLAECPICRQNVVRVLKTFRA